MLEARFLLHEFYLMQKVKHHSILMNYLYFIELEGDENIATTK